MELSPEDALRLNVLIANADAVRDRVSVLVIRPADLERSRRLLGGAWERVADLDSDEYGSASRLGNSRLYRLAVYRRLGGGGDVPP